MKCEMPGGGGRGEMQEEEVERETEMGWATTGVRTNEPVSMSSRDPRNIGPTRRAYETQGKLEGSTNKGEAGRESWKEKEG